MFPTLAHLVHYLTGIGIDLPIPTFGFFMVLAFIGAYFIFRSEYRRKEALGIIHPYPKEVTMGGGASGQLLLGAAAIGFIAGAKISWLILYHTLRIGSWQHFIFSTTGNLAGGVLLGALAPLGVFFYKKQYQLAVPRQETLMVHPWQLMDSLLLRCGIAGFVGAILFAKGEDTAGLFRHPLQWLFTFNGLTYYGALLFGAITYLYINRQNKIPLAIAADIGSPGMMLAYAIGRIGCHLSGDGDWGIPHPSPKPHWLSWVPDWTWSCYYPHNSIHQGTFIPGCLDNYCTQLPVPVYPTSFYEALICGILFITLWAIRSKITRPGLLFSIYALLNGAERFTIENIRINPRYLFLSYQFTQAQLIALLCILLGIIGISLSLAQSPKRPRSSRQ